MMDESDEILAKQVEVHTSHRAIASTLPGSPRKWRLTRNRIAEYKFIFLVTCTAPEDRTATGLIESLKPHNNKSRREPSGGVSSVVTVWLAIPHAPFAFVTVADQGRSCSRDGLVNQACRPKLCDKPGRRAPARALHRDCRAGLGQEEAPGPRRGAHHYHRTHPQGMRRAGLRL